MNQRDKLTYIREGQPPGSVYRYWSPWNKEVLVQQLGEYEDTGLSPQGIRNLEDLYVGLLMNKTRADWISVKDRLPENSRSVLIYTEDGGIAEGSYSSSEGWVQFRWSVKNAKATHWMPLPEPPKEGGQ